MLYIKELVLWICKEFDRETASAEDYYRRVFFIPYLKHLLKTCRFYKLPEEQLELITRLGSTLEACGNFRKSKRVLKKGLMVIKHNQLENTEFYGRLLNFKAYTLIQLDKIQQAETLLLQAAAVHTLSAFDKIMTLNRLGIVYNRKNNPTIAQKYLTEAIALGKSLLGDEHPMIARSLTFLGDSLTRQQQYEEAKQMLKNALTIKYNFYKHDHPSLAMTLKQLGITYGDCGEHQEQMKYFQQALTIEKQVYGDHHPHTKTTDKLIKTEERKP